MAGHTTEGSLGAIRGARREVRRNRGLAILSAVLALTVSLPLAQSNPLYIPFSPSDVKGVLYKPDARALHLTWESSPCIVRRTFWPTWAALNCPSVGLRFSQ